MNAQALDNQLGLQYLQALTSCIDVDGVPQIVQPCIVWDWGGTDYPVGSLPWQQAAALDLVPNTPVQGVALQGALPSFSKEYQLFLNFLNPNPSQKDPKYQQLQQDLTDTNRTLATAYTNARAAYANFVQSTSSAETFDQWLTGDGRPSKNAIDQAQQQVTSCQDAITKYLASLKGPVNDAVAAYDQGLIKVTGQDGNLITVAPWYTSSTPYEHVMDITGKNFGGPATNGSAMSFSIDESSSEYSASNVWGDGGVGFLDWFGIEVGGSYERVDTSSFASSYSLSFSFEDLATIPVTPGTWFDSAMLTDYRNGPFSPGYSGFKDAAGDVYFFGQGGTVARAYNAMVVGYRPTVTVDAGEEFAALLEEKITGESVIGIGPFGFEVNGGSTTEQATVTIEGSKITAKSQGDWPYIVALVSSWTVAPPS